MGEKHRKRLRWRGRDRESGTNVRCVTGPLQRPWTLSKTQSHTLLQKGAMKIFFMFTKTYLFISPSLHHLSIYFLLSQHPVLCCWNHVRWRRHAYPPLFSPLAFNTTAVGNQTALKQIDVLFNIVITSSQGPHASALVTTAGLLSLAQRWLPLCWSLQWFITKKRGRLWEWEKRERKGRERKKVPWILIECTGTFDWQGLISLSPS